MNAISKKFTTSKKTASKAQDALNYILDAFSRNDLVTQLFQKKNRKCLIALVCLTVLFLGYLIIPTVHATWTGSGKTDFISDYYNNTSKDAAITSQTARQIVIIAAQFSAMPFICLDMIPKSMTDVLTLKSTSSTIVVPKVVQPTVDSFIKLNTSNLASALSSLINEVKLFIEPLKAIAICIVVAYFMMSMLELAMSERMTIEYWIKYWSKLILGLAGVMWSDQIFDLLWQFNTAFTTFCSNTFSGATFVTAKGAAAQVAAQTSSYDQMQKIVIECFENFVSIMTKPSGVANTAQNIGTIIKSGPISILAVLTMGSFMIVLFIIFFLFAAIMFIIGCIIAVTRTLEIAVRGIFLPIGISALANDGWNGSGGRYVKKLIALMLQGGVLILIATIYNFLITNLVGNMMKNAVSTMGVTGGGTIMLISCFTSPIFLTLFAIVVGIACIVLMFKSMQVCNDMVGA